MIWKHLFYTVICRLSFRWKTPEVHYWRTSNGTEVDFVLYGPQGLLAFEVKRSSRLSKKDLSGLKSFATDFPEATLYFLYGGKRKEYHEGITILPVGTALATLSDLMRGTAPPADA